MAVNRFNRARVGAFQSQFAPMNLGLMERQLQRTQASQDKAAGDIDEIDLKIRALPGDDPRTKELRQGLISERDALADSLQSQTVINAPNIGRDIRALNRKRSDILANEGAAIQTRFDNFQATKQSILKSKMNDSEKQRSLANLNRDIQDPKFATAQFNPDTGEFAGTPGATIGTSVNYVDLANKLTNEIEFDQINVDNPGFQRTDDGGISYFTRHGTRKTLSRDKIRETLNAQLGSSTDVLNSLKFEQDLYGIDPEEQITTVIDSVVNAKTFDRKDITTTKKFTPQRALEAAKLDEQRKNPTRFPLQGISNSHARKTLRDLNIINSIDTEGNVTTTLENFLENQDLSVVELNNVNIDGVNYNGSYFKQPDGDGGFEYLSTLTMGDEEVSPTELRDDFNNIIKSTKSSTNMNNMVADMGNALTQTYSPEQLKASGLLLEDGSVNHIAALEVYKQATKNSMVTVPTAIRLPIDAMSDIAKRTGTKPEGGNYSLSALVGRDFFLFSDKDKDESKPKDMGALNESIGDIKKITPIGISMDDPNGNAGGEVFAIENENGDTFTLTTSSPSLEEKKVYEPLKRLAAAKATASPVVPGTYKIYNPSTKSFTPVQATVVNTPDTSGDEVRMGTSVIFTGLGPGGGDLKVSFEEAEKLLYRNAQQVLGRLD